MASRILSFAPMAERERAAVAAVPAKKLRLLCIRVSLNVRDLNIAWRRHSCPMPLSFANTGPAALIVGQDGILRAGWQPAPPSLFTRGSGGLPTRRRLPTGCQPAPQLPPNLRSWQN